MCLLGWVFQQVDARSSERVTPEELIHQFDVVLASHFPPIHARDSQVAHCDENIEHESHSEYQMQAWTTSLAQASMPVSPSTSQTMMQAGLMPPLQTSIVVSPSASQTMMQAGLTSSVQTSIPVSPSLSRTNGTTAGLKVDEGEVREVFDLCDMNGDGAISKIEFIKACRKNRDIADLFHLPVHIRQEDRQSRQNRYRAEVAYAFGGSALVPGPVCPGKVYD